MGQSRPLFISAVGRGFTLLELPVVFLIVAVLATVAILAFNEYKNHAYKTTVREDIVNCVRSVEFFVNEFNAKPTNFLCPSSGYGPATCSLSDGTNTLENAIKVSREVRIKYVLVTDGCGGNSYYKIHGVHRRLSDWGYCFNSCSGQYIETDGGGCP